MDTEYISRASRALEWMTLGKAGSSNRNRCVFWSRTRDVDPSIQSRVSVGNWVVNCGCHQLLHPHGSGTAMAEIWRSR